MLFRGNPFTQETNKEENSGATAQYKYWKFSLTDTGVAAAHAPGFTCSVYPCLHVFHETPIMQVKNPRTHNAARIL
jgi:hypothetical protein